MRPRRRAFAAAAAVLGAASGSVLAGCAADETAPPPPAAPGPLESMPSPAGPGSGEPNLTVGPDGVYLTWLERTGTDRHALRLARWDGEAWDPPRTVVERAGLFVNWADFPSLGVLPDGTLLAHWLEKSGAGTYAYDVRLAVSTDGGATWAGERSPHLDGLEVEHGFVSILPLDDRFAISWLDGRETAAGGPMTLRTAVVSRTGEVRDRALIDDRVCDCCQTAMARTADGLLLAYRDRGEDEVRDIAVARYDGSSWSAGRPVHEDGWVIPGCPVNGPSVAARDDQVALAWFTGAPLPPDADASTVRSAGERGRVLLAQSTDAGRTFGPPVRIDGGGAMGRVATTLLEDGTALVAWMERTDAAAEVRVRAVRDGVPGPPALVTGTPAERASGFPRLAVYGSRVLFAWTEPGEPPAVRVASAPLPRYGGAR